MTDLRHLVTQRRWKIGELVRTPLGHLARITGYRDDGNLDAEYEDGPCYGEKVILHAAMIVRGPQS